MENRLKPQDDLRRCLIEVHDTILIVIDVQDHFVSKLPHGTQSPLVNRICWLTAVAHRLGVPIVATAEDISANGVVSETLARQLPQDTPIYDKMTFGLTGQHDILAAVTATGRRTAVLIGLETDVCVSQSAIGLMQNGYSVCVPADACASPADGHAVGIERMRAAGVTITSVKALYYEWVRTVAADKAFRQDRLAALRKAAGITL